MYVFGGRSNQTKTFNDMWYLKVSQSGICKWTKIETKGIAPEGRYGHTSAITNKHIYIGGGRAGSKIFDDLFLFDTISETWVHPKVTGDKPPPRYYHRALSLNNGNEIMIFGGVRPKEFITYPRVYILQMNDEQREKEKEINKGA